MTMRKISANLLAAALAVNTMLCMPMASVSAANAYEFENGTIFDTGENETKVVSLSDASGGKAVDLRDGGDAVTLTVDAENAGNHRLTIRYSQPYDEAGKYQNVIVNGANAGQILCGYTGDGTFSTVSISANLKKGSNTVTVEGSWGWSILDSLTVEEALVSTSVSAKLSNPNASAQAQSLYSFLCDTYGNYTLSGQQEYTWMGSEDYEFEIIRNASGRLPAVRGLDYMGDDFAGCNRRAISWYKQGGIVTICWHCGSDFRGSHTESLESNLDWSKALTPGTSEYNNLIAGMDKGAKALLELKEAGVPVVWRPFHEFDGKWFWWGKGGGENFKKLWQIMYDRYTNYWGLDNLIWNLGYCGDVNSGWYPGDAYVDIIGADTYVNHTDSLVNMYQKTAQIAQKPVCLHENGPIPDPDKMAADNADWLWFMTWHTSFIDSHAINTASYIDHVYNSEHILTLDELPDIYHYQGNAGDDGGDDTGNDNDSNVIPEDGVYELEKGKIADVGENRTEVVSLSGASGGKAVDLRDEGDAVSVTVQAENAGAYRINIRYSQPYDENGKYQNVIVNDKNAGQICCEQTGESQFAEAVISANLNAGSNTITIEGAWGWTLLDCLTIEEGSLMGDVNADGAFNVADIVLMQKWLLAKPDAVLADAAAGDLCADGTLNAFDLAMMKKRIVQDRS